MNTACSKCLKAGHFCPAQVDLELCVFCEDGEPCPASLKAAREVPSAPIVKQEATRPERGKVNAMPKKPERPSCAHEGCDRKLNSNNSTGFCFEHFLDSKRKSEPKFAGPKPIVRKKREKAAAAEPEAEPQSMVVPHVPQNADRVHTIRLTETQIDGLLRGLQFLPGETKVRVLEAALATI